MDEIRPWIKIEDEHGDEVLMRWPDDTKKASKNFFWISVGLCIVLAAALGLCWFGLFCWRLIKLWIGGLI